MHDSVCIPRSPKTTNFHCYSPDLFMSSAVYLAACIIHLNIKVHSSGILSYDAEYLSFKGDSSIAPFHLNIKVHSSGILSYDAVSVIPLPLFILDAFINIINRYFHSYYCTYAFTFCYYNSSYMFTDIFIYECVCFVLQGEKGMNIYFHCYITSCILYILNT
jgi:hypothetical protein